MIDVDGTLLEGMFADMNTLSLTCYLWIQEQISSTLSRIVYDLTVPIPMDNMMVQIVTEISIVLKPVVGTSNLMDKSLLLLRLMRLTTTEI